MAEPDTWTASNLGDMGQESGSGKGLKPTTGVTMVVACCLL